MVVHVEVGGDNHGYLLLLPWGVAHLATQGVTNRRGGLCVDMCTFISNCSIWSWLRSEEGFVLRGNPHLVKHLAGVTGDRYGSPLVGQELRCNILDLVEDVGQCHLPETSPPPLHVVNVCMDVG